MSVQEIIKNKKYRISVVLGYNGNQRIRHTETFNGGKREAIIRENELKLQARNNTLILKKNITIAELIEEWKKYTKDKVAVKTYVNYELHTKRINNAIGHIKLKNLNVKILEDFYADLKENSGLAERTLKDIYTTMSNILNRAIKWEYISNNPNEIVEPIKVHRKEMSYYTPDEVQELLEVLKQESPKNRAIILLALDSGIRRGELTGLTWDDIDLKNGKIVINKVTQYVAGYGTFEKEPKTPTSNRAIYISKETIKALETWKREQAKQRLLLGDKWGNSKRIFTTEYGADMHPNTPSKILSSIIKRHNLKYINFHGLRHTSITLLINSGVQTQIISRRAGHSNVTTTHQIYSHFFDDEFKGIADTMEKILNNDSEKSKVITK